MGLLYSVLHPYVALADWREGVAAIAGVCNVHVKYNGNCAKEQICGVGLMGTRII